MLDCHSVSLVVFRLEPTTVPFSSPKISIGPLERVHLMTSISVQVLCPQLENGTKIVVCLSGRGDKDVNTAAKYIDSGLAEL